MHAYIKNGRLHVSGLAKTDLGYVPFHVHVKARSCLKDGAVSTFAGDQTHPALSEALRKSSSAATSQVDAAKMKAASEQLVNRARLGDQNAVAMIVGVRENAKKGMPRAQTAFKLLHEACKKKPSGPSIGEDEESPDGFFQTALSALRMTVQSGLNTSQKYVTAIMSQVPGIGNGNQAAHALADGPAITVQILKETQDAQPNAAAKTALSYAVKNARKPSILEKVIGKATPDAKKALAVGFALGNARMIQEVREGASPIGKYWPDVAWELGE